MALGFHMVGDAVGESLAESSGRELYGVTAGHVAKHVARSFNRLDGVFSLGKCLEQCDVAYCEDDCGASDD